MESNELQRIKFLKQAPVVFTEDEQSFYLPTASKAGKQAIDTITRPNDKTAYVADDVVSTLAGDILEFTNLGMSGDMVMVLGVRLFVAVDTVPNGCTGFKLHLYNGVPTAIADNTAFNLPIDDVGKYLGYIDIPTPASFGDTVFSQGDDINFTAKLVGTSLYGILQTVGAYTPQENVEKTIILNVVGV